jgi:hypothetical protein
MYTKAETLELSQTFATRLANAAAIVRILWIFIVLRRPGGWPRACSKLTQTLLEVRHLPNMTVVTSPLHQLPGSECNRLISSAILQGTAHLTAAMLKLVYRWQEFIRFAPFHGADTRQIKGVSLPSVIGEIGRRQSNPNLILVHLNPGNLR